MTEESQNGCSQPYRVIQRVFIFHMDESGYYIKITVRHTHTHSSPDFPQHREKFLAPAPFCTTLIKKQLSVISRRVNLTPRRDPDLACDAQCRSTTQLGTAACSALLLNNGGRRGDDFPSAEFSHTESAPGKRPRVKYDRPHTNTLSAVFCMCI